MQLRKMVVLFTALSAVGLMMSCGDETGAAGGFCNSDADCTGNEICHLEARACVTKCTTSSDCTANASTCAPIGGTSAQKDTTVCQCTTTAACNQDRSTADQVCGDLDHVCVTACSQDSDCSTGRTCDTATGQCKASATDPCNGQCTASETCDTSGGTPTCKPAVGAACTDSSQSTCAYGQFCSSNVCAAAPVAPTTCENFPTSSRPQWDPATSNGPVIYEVSKITYQVKSSLCQQPSDPTITSDAYITRVRAYRTDANWPDTRAGLSGFFYVTTQAAKTDVVGSGLLVPNTGYNRNPNNPKDAEFQVYLCRPSNGGNQLQVGFYFTNGNPVCQVLPRQ